MGKLWSLKRKLRGIVAEPPTAMIDSRGNLVTTSSTIEKLTMETYKERLEPPSIKSGLQLHQLQRENLCDKRLNEAHENKTRPWTTGDLDIVLKHLKVNKSRDPLAFANELFKPNNAEEDLKLAVLQLMNQIKSQ